MGKPKRGAAAKAEAKEETKKAKGGLGVNEQLPEFELETDEEKTLSSADLVKDNGIILFCYPKANTKGCTSQAVGLCEKSKELAEAGYKLYGISADKPKSQANWKKKEDITCTLLCDPSQEVLGKLGFLKGSKINRSHIVVEKGGKVLDVQYGITPKVSVKDAVEFCLEHKGEPAAAEQAEEAAAAGEEAEAKAEQQEGPKEEAGVEAEAADKQQGDKAEEEAAAEEEKKDEAAPMDTDAAPAEEPAAEEQQDKPAEDAPAAAEPAAEEAAPEQQDAEREAAEGADESKAGEDAPEAAPEEPPAAAAADEAAPEPAAEEPAAPAAAAEGPAPEQPAAEAAAT